MPPATATSSGQAMQNLQAYQGSMKTPDQAAVDANNALGVGGAQQQVQGLRGAIAKTTGLLQQVAPSVYGRTQNSLVTNAQATRQIGNESAPIQQNLTQQQQDYTGANADLQDLERQAESRASNTISGQNSQLSYLQQIYRDMQASEQAQRDEQYRQETLAEQKRQNARTASGSAGASPTFGGGGSSGVGSTAQASLAHDQSGGWQVKDAAGKPITLGQYVSSRGGSPNDVLSLLQQGSVGDKAIAANIQRVLSGGKYTWQTLQPYLVKDYPQVFGG